MEEFRTAVLNNNFIQALQCCPKDTPDGTNVLHISASLGILECVVHLVECTEFDLDTKDASGWSPLMHAIANGHTEVARHLIQKGKCNTRITDTFQQTCLHIEAQTPSTSSDMAKILVSHGAIIDAEDTEGATSFLRSVEAHNLLVAEFLYMAGCNIHARSHNGRCALHIVAYHHFLDMVLWLVHIGCSVRVFDNNFQTPLMLCLLRKHQPNQVLHILKTLLEVGSEVNAQDCNGNTALLLALSNAAIIKKEHIDLLLKHGADANIPNKAGLTPIWQAIYDGLHYPDRMEIISLLLYQNCYLDMSCRGKLLFTSGIDTVYCCETFMSPLEVALDSGFYEAARMLVIAGCTIRPNVRCNTLAASDMPPELTWFQHALENPPSLQHLSRLVIRKVLGESILTTVSDLPLPEKMKEYVLLRDLVIVDA